MRLPPCGHFSVEREIELGPQTDPLHAELGAAVAQAGVDLLIAIGEPPRVTARAAQDASAQDLQVQCFDDAASACDRLRDLIREDDIVLVKGSRTARLERVVERLIEDYG